jgi:signal transduction histidine kinase
MRPSGGRARLSVADEGPGIAPAEAELAVRRFWRGSEARGRSGSGLGLAIVAAIAERHGGRLKIAGARFTLDLPALKRLSESRATVP